MPHATGKDGVRIHYEEAGAGTPILFAHEFGGNYRSWEPQMRYFARRHRCITYAARGYPPSDIPQGADQFSYEHQVRDALAVLDHLGIAKAHVVGLSMGGFMGLVLGMRHPDRALSLTLAGTGAGSHPDAAVVEEFRAGVRTNAARFETAGQPEAGRVYANTPSRIPFMVKDPRGWRHFADELELHDARGAAHTLRGYQAARPSIYEFEAEIARITVPTLIMCGDEDDVCVMPSLFLKRTIATSGLLILPKTGHTLNIEEPALFNDALERFIALAEAGRWPARDPRSLA